MEGEKDGVIDRIVDLLNSCMQNPSESEKVTLLTQAQELVIGNDLLDNFLDEVIGFQNDHSAEVRRFVVGFIEASCKKDAENFSKLLNNLSFLLNDNNSNVVKKSIQVATQLFKGFLLWVATTRMNEQLQSAYETWIQLKHFIFDIFDSTENDGIRTQSIKFMETLVVLQTPPERSAKLGEEHDLDFEVLNKSTLLRADEIEKEAEQVFDQLLQFFGSPHISSVNLMATMQSLVLISKKRSSKYLEKVVQSMVSLNANLPPTLAKSQVSSVKKQLKLQMFLLLKHPEAIANSKYQLQLVELLTDLGATQSDIGKCFQEVRKRGIKVELYSSESKRIKLEHSDANGNSSNSANNNNNAVATASTVVSNGTAAKVDQQQSTSNSQNATTSSTRKFYLEHLPFKVTRSDANQAVENTTEFLIPKLNSIENVCDLVLVSMLSLPENMPSHFQTNYASAGEPGSSAQIEVIARQLATVMTAASLGKGVEETLARFEPYLRKSTTNEKELSIMRQLVMKAISQEIRKQEQLKLNVGATTSKALSTGKQIPSTKAIKQLNFAEITKEPTEAFKQQTVIDCLKRILEEDGKQFFASNQFEIRSNIISLLAVEFCEKYPEGLMLVKDYAFNDLRTRLDLLVAVTQKAYVLAQKLDRMEFYNRTLDCILHHFMQQTEAKERDLFLPKYFMELPNITDDSLNVLELYILESRHHNSIANGFNVVKHLIEKIGEMRYKLLDFILKLCLSENGEVKKHAFQTIKLFYENSDEKLRRQIEQFALSLLRKLLQPRPPPEIPISNEWGEDAIKHCLLPYLSLLPINHNLIHDLALVYVGAMANVKRIILRSLEAPVKGMGMASPQLLLLVESCPKGAETLVTRIIHVLTDKQAPSADLVSRVRDLYQKRVPDVRFLIPVLNGLTKKEVIEALPKLIMLNPVVVKEVFNRLLADSGSSGGQSPLTPSELLVALHNIDSTKCDMKTIIKATGLCFSEKSIYTAEVLAVVMQLLMEQNPTPTLLMRTVIQSLALYPRLNGFVMNILQRLIMKQVWKEKKLWEGFIKCCQRTQPQSFQVLLQLPAAQLQTVFSTCPDFKPALQEHVNNFTDTQRSHMPQSILDAIFSGQTSEFNSSIEDTNSQPPAVDGNDDNESYCSKLVEPEAE